MGNKERTPQKVNGTDGDAHKKVLWGAKAIGEPVECTPKKIYNLFERGLLKSVRKVGGRLQSHRDALLAEFGAPPPIRQAPDAPNWQPIGDAAQRVVMRIAAAPDEGKGG